MEGTFIDSDGSPVQRQLSGRMLVVSILRVLGSVAVVLVMFTLAPVDKETGLAGAVLLVLSLVIFIVVLVWQVRAVLTTSHPMRRAIEALGITSSLFVCLFALQYLAQSQADSGAFTVPLDKFDSLYYTLVVFTTVGFGDITPVTRSARLISMVQMVGGFIFIAAGVKVLTSAARQRYGKVGGS